MHFAIGLTYTKGAERLASGNENRTSIVFATPRIPQTKYFTKRIFSARYSGKFFRVDSIIFPIMKGQDPGKHFMSLNSSQWWTYDVHSYILDRYVWSNSAMPGVPIRIASAAWWKRTGNYWIENQIFNVVHLNYYQSWLTCIKIVEIYIDESMISTNQLRLERHVQKHTDKKLPKCCWSCIC